MTFTRKAHSTASLSQYERFYAVFRPRKTDDLRYDAEEWIGLRALWEAYWVIEEGEHMGEWACGVVRGYGPQTEFVWVPSGDLEPDPVGLCTCDRCESIKETG